MHGNPLSLLSLLPDRFVVLYAHDLMDSQQTQRHPVCVSYHLHIEQKLESVMTFLSDSNLPPLSIPVLTFLYSPPDIIALDEHAPKHPVEDHRTLERAVRLHAVSTDTYL